MPIEQIRTAPALCATSTVRKVLSFISTSGLMIFANVFGLYGLERFNYGPEKGRA